MQSYVNDLKEVLDKIDFSKIEGLIRLIKKSDIIWVIGNGGSCASAEHLAEDLVKMAFKRAVAVTSPALLTMASNDESQPNMFLYPLMRLVSDDDLVLAISISGKSPNILNALDCEGLNCSKFLITGLGGKDLDVNKIIIPTLDYQIGEDVCLVIMHHVVKFYSSVN